MLREDQEVWTAFIESKVLELDEVWYDVHVGRPMDVPEGSPSYLWDVAEGVSRKRIDAVGRKGKQTFIIEVKPIANAVALGQVMTYSNLFIDEFELIGPLQGLVVARWIDRDIVDIAGRSNVKIIALKGWAL